MALTAIHKDLTLNAKIIDYSIQNCQEIEGVEISMHADGWIIAEPYGIHIEPWSRNKDDYRIEKLDVQTIYDNIELT